MTADYQFIELSLSDYHAIEAIEKQCHSHPWSENTIRSCFGKRYYAMGLINNQAQLLGYCFLEHICGEATLMNIAITPNEQGKGLGEMLLQQAMAWCLTQGDHTLWLEVRVSNKSAIKLYEKLNFIEVSIRPNYYPSANGKGKEDALLMTLML